MSDQQARSCRPALTRGRYQAVVSQSPFRDSWILQVYEVRGWRRVYAQQFVDTEEQAWAAAERIITRAKELAR